MTEFRAQIRRVRMKDGADVTVLRPALSDAPDRMAAEAHRHVNILEKNGGMDGFVVIGLYSDGSSAIGFNAPERLPRALLMTYLIEILRRDIIVDAEAERVFDNKFQWVDK